MKKLEVMWNLSNVEIIPEIIKLFCILLFTEYIFIKIIDIKKVKVRQSILITINMLISTIIATIVKYKIDSYCSLLLLIVMVTLINKAIHKKDIIYSTLITIISFSINYSVYIIAVIISFFPNAFFTIENDYISLCSIILIYCLLLYYLFKMKKFKYGISFLKKKLQNSYYNLLIINISTIILFSIIMFQKYDGVKTRQLGVTFIIVAFVMFTTIRLALKLHYKQNLLIKDLEETKKELEYKKQEIEKLEKENLKFGEISHSLAHKQKSLQYKIEQIIKENKVVKTEEIKELEERVQQISEELYVEPKDIELTKTNITIIDDMLKCMQAECIEKNIKFDLQINGNIHYLINNLIEKEKLEILLADHIKDAIIAINHSNNENKSILVKLGKFDGIYSLYIYDSGIEFEKDTLEKLGSKPITTHADTGGTGIGFMKTFNTLRQCKASLIIEEYRKPCNENYTKAIIIKFDKKQEYKVKSYRDISINKLIK